MWINVYIKNKIMKHILFNIITTTRKMFFAIQSFVIVMRLDTYAQKHYFFFAKVNARIQIPNSILEQREVN